MLVIRFQRVGRRNDPAYRIVVTEKRSKPHSSGIEILGSYHPKTKTVTLNAERILYWLAKGARPSATVHNLLIRKGVVNPVSGNLPRATAEPLARAANGVKGKKIDVAARVLDAPAPTG